MGVVIVVVGIAISETIVHCLEILDSHAHFWVLYGVGAGGEEDSQDVIEQHIDEDVPPDAI